MFSGDDELPPAISSSGGPNKPSVQVERVRLVAYHNKEAPLEQHRQHVLLEVMDTSPSAVERSGLDLVAVLDVSSSMSGDKLNKLKAAMKFVIGKLGRMDRLSIVSFSDTAKKWCPLLCMTRESQAKLRDVVENGLKADGRTNMRDGLVAGLQVLSGRQHKVGRVGSIILMSDGDQNLGNAELVDIGDDVAVYTFGFGAGEFAKVLATIASNSRGGTFYFVRDGESLSEHFSQILAGLLSVVVQDLKLIVWERPGHSKIDEVDAGGYPSKRDDRAAGSVTVSFGDLYSREVRKVIVNLMLPAVDRGYRAKTVLFAQCWYSIQGKYMYSPGDHLRCDMRRTGTAMPPDDVKPEVRAELLRRCYTVTLRKALEDKDNDRAKRKLEETKRDLDDADDRSNNPMIKVLRTELMLLLRLATWTEFISCLLASWTSHYRQRFAGRGDVSIRVFDTPCMQTYLVHAKEFDKNPSVLVPSVDEDDVREKVAAEIRMVNEPRIRDESREHITRSRSYSGWAWRAVILLCTVLAIAVIVAGAAVFAVFLLYKPKMPCLVVSDAQLVQLQYGGQDDGTIRYLQASITILAENNNSKADASFSRVDLALGFHGADVALLRAEPFVVARESSLPLRYNVVSAGQALDPDGIRAMDEALKDGVVPLDLFGKARTRWKVGVFVNLKFWTRVSCRLRFFFPGNGTVMTTDRQRCRSRSP